ncbi:MdtA/MuxA family multidrug efflux RND transporter periplasmic adaptor subunit [Acidipila rosea]|uniref:Multidrug efflux system membrane fusion protein n=1 Tax=Acidipila rosea TaxID=768535 RepID=A0A4R1L3R4_9BACT|nr:MdtA/MuxA family multidrug efflux RND transporter periplasmic adaptor subunit [Acidipila rosea]TCK70839.1 multidrug efflux system membrane fusion protein [Acidipila rosea]
MSSTQIPPPAYKVSESNDAPPKRHKGLTFIILLLLAAVVGYFIWRIATANNKVKQEAAQKQEALVNMAMPVQVAAVQQQSIPIYVTALGTVTPYYTVTVKARVTGELLKVNFKEGQDVTKGDELMVIDPRPYEAALAQAKGQLARDQAQLRNNQAEYNRYKALYSEGVVSKEQLDLYESNLGQYQGAIQADKATIDTAALNVAYCHVTSPISGRVGLRLVDPGNVITANTTNLIIINQFKPIAVVFTLPEDQLPRVLNKMRGRQALEAEAYDRNDIEHIASGELLTADNQIDTTTGTAKLKAVFANKTELLFPNQFVNVHLILETQPKAITMPAAALQHGTNGDYVWVVNSGNTVAMRQVTVDLTEGATTILASGLKPGDQVVTDGADKLRDAMKVIPRQMDMKRQTRPRISSGSDSGMMGS